MTVRAWLGASLTGWATVLACGPAAVQAQPAPGPELAAPAPLPVPPNAGASAPDAAAEPDAGRALWNLEIVAPAPIQTLLNTYLDVSRFRQASDVDAITRGELTRLVAITPAQVRELLQPLGYFKPVVQAEVVSPGGTEREALVRVTVEPGPQAVVGRLTLEVQGAAQDEADAGSTTAQRLITAVRDEWPLVEGAVFAQLRWVDAKNALLGRLRAAGYASASFSGTVAQVDPATQKVRIFAVVDSGPRFQFGDLAVEGLSRYDPRVVTRLMTFVPGETYSERAMLDFEERLRKVGLFESVTVDMDPDPALAQAVPIRVRLRELQLRQSTVGIGVTSNSGNDRGVEPRLTLEHTDRRVFGEKWTSKTKAELGGTLLSLQQDFLSYPQNGFYRNLISGAYSVDETQQDVKVVNGKFRLGRTQDGDRIERLYYGEWQRAVTTSAGVSNGSSAFSGNYEWIWRDLDNQLLPTRGLAASAKVTLGRSFSARGPDAGEAGPFGRVAGRMTYYRPLGGNWFGQGHIEAGEVLGAANVAVPYTLLFRAGGDESVRGYTYQSLGPTSNGVAVGGRVLGTASLELARPFSERLAAWWWAVFVDAGDAARDWQALDPKLGYGAGVRWRSPVGPLRFDAAWGAEDRQLRYHFSVGITF